MFAYFTKLQKYQQFKCKGVSAADFLKIENVEESLLVRALH